MGFLFVNDDTTCCRRRSIFIALNLISVHWVESMFNYGEYSEHAFLLMASGEGSQPKGKLIEVDRAFWPDCLLACDWSIIVPILQLLLVNAKIWEPRELRTGFLRTVKGQKTKLGCFRVKKTTNSGRELFPVSRTKL